MSKQGPKPCAKRLRMALDMATSGILMRRAQIERAHPMYSPEEVDRELRRWLCRQPEGEGRRPGARGGE